MAYIDYILPENNFELVRSKIASILATELANQAVLISTKIALGGLSPEEEYSLNLSLECIPSKVYEERNVKVSPVDLPFLNVILANVPLNDLVPESTQNGTNRYAVESWHGSLDSDSERGDLRASKKLQRLLGMCRSILMDKNYRLLDFDFGIVGDRVCTEIAISQPNPTTESSENEIYGRFFVDVLVHEEVKDLSGTALEGIDATQTINDDEISWSINY